MSESGGIIFDGFSASGAAFTVPVKMGLKYCGGCCPRFDRVEIVEMIQKSLDDTLVFLSPDSPALDAVLVVAGCPSACVDTDRFQDVPVITIRSPGDAETFVLNFKRMLNAE